MGDLESDYYRDARPRSSPDLDACRAAYKKGLIDAAQAVCRHCRRSKPTVLPGVISHGGVLCNAVGIIEILEMSGGWQAEWPRPGHESEEA